MNNVIQKSSGAADRELATSRLLDFPRTLVFEAFRDPKHLAQWWGPNGFTNTFEEFDFQPGGNWRFVMHAPNGADFPNHHVIEEILKPKRIVLRHMSRPHFQLTVTLAEEAGKTRIGWHMLFETAEERAKVATFAVDANEQNLDRLTAELTKMSPPRRPFIISRLFDAPRDLVWKTWTDGAHMQWWGPTGVTIERAKMELRPGGTFHYCMKTPDGNEMWGKWVIREVEAPKRLVFVNSFSDSAGGITRHPMSPNWPLEILSTITFTEKNGNTQITVEWLPINATETEGKTFDESHPSMTQGWGGTLDRLEEYLGRVQGGATQ